MLQAGAHLGGLFGCHDRPFEPQVLSIKTDKILNAVTAGLKCRCFGTGNSLHFPSNVA